jgi:2-oxoglutarate ferredoxin oxidoreductase subunit beta
MSDIIDTSRPPEERARKVGDFSPSLLLTENHHLCSGCGHPIAVRIILETLEQLNLHRNTVALMGHGCSGTFNMSVDVDCTIALHGRAPAAATGLKRMRPDVTVWTLQGDGDMVSEGLAEILQAAARGERITCFMLNNGVFGDTGGQMTAATPVGQRTKTSVEGRDASTHGYPFPLLDMVAALPGVGYAARGSVYNAAGITATRKLVREAFLNQHEGHGLAIVEILTMCPTGWFLPANEGPDYMMKSLGQAYPIGLLKGRASPEPAKD